MISIADRAAAILTRRTVRQAGRPAPTLALTLAMMGARKQHVRRRARTFTADSSQRLRASTTTPTPDAATSFSTIVSWTTIAHDRRDPLKYANKNRHRP